MSACSNINIRQYKFTETFSCLLDKCPDTCCQGWGMQLDNITQELYRTKAPELLDAADTENNQLIMRRDKTTDFCVKYTDGLCSIHKKYGDKFLGDACNFYPRIIRKIGDDKIMSAALSCPETVRLVLYSNEPFSLEYSSIDREPSSLKEYTLSGMAMDEWLHVHQAFMQLLNQDLSAEQVMKRITTVARSLDSIPVKDWREAVDFLIPTADVRIPAAEIDENDPYNLINSLIILLKAANKMPSPRLAATLESIETALVIKINYNDCVIETAGNNKENYYKILLNKNVIFSNRLNNILLRYIGAQLSMNLFPFAGKGNSISDRILIIAIKFAITRLALQCSFITENSIDNPEIIIRVIQSLSRFLDHLTDPSLSLSIYHEYGWHRESRLISLI